MWWIGDAERAMVDATVEGGDMISCGEVLKGLGNDR